MHIVYRRSNTTTCRHITTATFSAAAFFFSAASFFFSAAAFFFASEAAFFLAATTAFCCRFCTPCTRAYQRHYYNIIHGCQTLYPCHTYTTHRIHILTLTFSAAAFFLAAAAAFCCRFCTKTSHSQHRDSRHI